jgi:hypothetical protein
MFLGFPGEILSTGCWGGPEKKSVVPSAPAEDGAGDNLVYSAAPGLTHPAYRANPIQAQLLA